MPHQTKRAYNVTTAAKALCAKDRVMKSRIVRIDNSQGIRIPKPLLQKAGLSGDVELVAKEGMLIVQAAKGPRSGWAGAFQEMAAHQDDQPVDKPVPPAASWDGKEWSW